MEFSGRLVSPALKSSRLVPKLRASERTLPGKCASWPGGGERRIGLQRANLRDPVRATKLPRSKCVPKSSTSERGAKISLPPVLILRGYFFGASAFFMSKRAGAC